MKITSLSSGSVDMDVPKFEHERLEIDGKSGIRSHHSNAIGIAWGGASRDLGMSAENGGIYAMRTASGFSTRKPRINLYRCS